jgi:hypothetical protein
MEIPYKTPVVRPGVIAGKIISLAEAIRLTDNFSVEIARRTHVVFDARRLAGLMDAAKTELIAFRYTRFGTGIGLVAMPVDPQGPLGFMALGSGDARNLSHPELVTRTDNFTYAIDGIQAHIFRSELVFEIIKLSGATIKVYFGRNDSKPVLVFTPTSLSGYGLSEMVCLNVGACCPPFCIF